jgi:Flp pilus assembly protein TadG
MTVQDTLRRVVDTPVGRCARIWLAVSRPFAWRGRNSKMEQGECGSSMVEFALTFSVLMSFVFTLMELCTAFYTYSMVSESAREATRYSAVHGSTCVTSASASCSATSTAVSTYAKGLGFPNIGGGTLNVTTTFLPNGTNVPGNRVHVDIKYVFPIRLPFVRGNSLSFDTSSEMYILQ